MSDTQTSSEILAAALDYAARGWRVIPCNGKAPNRTRNGFKDASCDPEQIHQWWDAWPGDNVGIVAPDDVLILDVDRAKEDRPTGPDNPDGLVELAKLEAVNGPLPATMTTRTGRGGLHLWFRLPPGVTREHGNSRGLLPKCFDVRSCGSGQGVAPPSRHPDTGNLYAWEPGKGPGEIEIAPIPAWLLNLVEPPRAEAPPRAVGTFKPEVTTATRYGRRVLEYEAAELAGTTEGGRNNQLFKAAASCGELVAGGELPEADVWDALRGACEVNGLMAEDGEAVVMTTIRSGLTKGKQNPRNAPGDGGALSPATLAAHVAGEKADAEAPTQLEALNRLLSDPDACARRVDPLAPTFAEGYGAAGLAAARRRPLLPIGVLPSWLVHPTPHGHGWGPRMAGLLAGGLSPGDVVGIAASQAKAGKTSFLAQLADGLALRCAELVRHPEQEPGAPLTPVLWLSEMGMQDLTWRTLARWTGDDSSIFRKGAASTDDALWEKGLAALTAGPLHEAQAFMRRWKGGNTGAALVTAVSGAVTDWRADLEARYAPRTVCPVIVIDPLQRWQDAGASSEVAALNELVEALGAAAEEHGWIVLLTSDTNKESATREPSKAKETGTTHAGAAALARGSYKLFHLCTAVMVLRPAEDAGLLTLPPNTPLDSRPVDVSLAAFRWGNAERGDGACSVRYAWTPKTGRWVEQGAPTQAKGRYDG